MKKLVASPQVKEAVKWKVAHSGEDVLDFAREQGWDDVRICGHGPMITSPVEHESGWKLVPAPMDSSIIPSAALRRVEVLENAEITCQGLIIAHEPVVESATEPVEEERGDLFNKKWLKYAGLGAAVVALSPLIVVAAGVIVAVGAATLALGAIGVLLGAIGTVSMGDPSLIMVCDDGTWIELYVWYE